MESEEQAVVAEDTQANEDFSGLKAKNSRLVAENTKFKNSFKSYGGVEGALQRLADLEAREQEVAASAEAEAVKAGQIDAIKSAHEKKLTELQKAHEALEQRIIKMHIDKLITDAVIAEKGSLKLLGPHLATAVTGVLDKNGEVQVTVKGLDGAPLESVTDLVATLKGDESFGAAFDAIEVVGGGTRPSGAKANTNPFATATADTTEQMKLINERPEDAKRLALAAGWPKERILWA